MKVIRKPKFYDSMFGETVRNAVDTGELTLNNVKDWEIEYNNGKEPNPPFNTTDIIRYYMKIKGE